MAKRTAQATMKGGAIGKQIPWWIWFLGGLFAGLSLSALVLMKQWAPQLRPAEVVAAKPVVPATDAARADERPKYDFYSVLPEMEVVVPDAEVKSAAAATSPPPTAGDPPSGGTVQRYVLQAASFRSMNDADAMKAKLTLLGIGAPVTVQAVNVNGVEYFRVRLGPYADLRAVDSAKRSLESNGISAIALRESGMQ